jgi:hypothetical protein
MIVYAWSLATEAHVWAMVVVVVLPLTQLVVEDLGVVDDDALQEPVELLAVDAVGAFDLPFSRGLRGLM